jgi:hypothetical protein
MALGNAHVEVVLRWRCGSKHVGRETGEPPELSHRTLSDSGINGEGVYLQKNELHVAKKVAKWVVEVVATWR